MQRNATKCNRINSSPLQFTRDEAKTRPPRGHAGTVRTSERVPNEATLASFPASPLGVNGAKRAKLSHKIEISRESVVPAQAADKGDLINSEQLRVV